MLAGSPDLQKFWTPELREQVLSILKAYPQVRLYVRPSIRLSIKEEAILDYGKLELSAQGGILVLIVWKKKQLALAYGPEVSLPPDLELRMAEKLREGQVITALKLLLEHLD